MSGRSAASGVDPRIRPRQLARNLVQFALSLSGIGRRFLWSLPPRVSGVALTFDDGPDPVQTPEILDILAARRVCATFFVVGRQIERYPHLVKRIAAAGHTLGNHTFSHRRCDRLAREELDSELARTDALLAGIRAADLAPIFRPPWGALRPDQIWRLLRAGRRVVLWNRDSRDYRGSTADDITAAGRSLKAGDILLLHDRFPATLEALPRLLDALEEIALPVRSLDAVLNDGTGDATARRFVIR